MNGGYYVKYHARSHQWEPFRPKQCCTFQVLVCVRCLHSDHLHVGRKCSAQKRLWVREKYTDEHSDSSWLTRMKCPVIFEPLLAESFAYICCFSSSVVHSKAPYSWCWSGIVRDGLHSLEGKLSLCCGFMWLIYPWFYLLIGSGATAVYTWRDNDFKKSLYWGTSCQLQFPFFSQRACAVLREVYLLHGLARSQDRRRRYSRRLPLSERPAVAQLSPLC